MQLISIGQFHKVIEKYLYWLSLPSIGFTDILEIIIISVIVYQMLKWVQLTRAWTLFKGIKRTGRTVVCIICSDISVKYDIMAAFEFSWCGNYCSNYHISARAASGFRAVGTKKDFQ